MARQGSAFALARLETRPEIPPPYAHYWEAFHALSRDRAMGFGPGPIPWSAIDRYATRIGLTDPDAFADLAAVVMAVDGRYLALLAERTKQQKPDPTERRRR